MRALRWSVEQPLNSILYVVPEFSVSLKILSGVRMVTHLGAFGGKSVKPLEFFHNFPADSVSIIVRGKAAANSKVAAGRILQRASYQAESQI